MPFFTAGARRAAAITFACAAGGLGALAGPASAAGPDRLVTWGYNSQGQLGDGTTQFRDVPTEAQLPAGVTVASVAGSSRLHSLAVTGDGRVLAWGNNNQGQLGDGTTSDRHAPVFTDLSILHPGETVTQVAGGEDHTYALTSEGRALAWGNNLWGNLGDGTTTNRQTPVEISLPAGVTLTAIAAGYNHGLGVTSDGELLAWGRNANGQLGIGSTGGTEHLPVPVDLSVLDSGETITAVASMTNHSLARTSQGRVIAWGDNQWGQLGDGTTTARNAPVLVDLPAGASVASIGIGWDHSLAVTTDGEGLGWGTDDYGQLGNGEPTPLTQTEVTSIVLPAGVQLAKLDGGIDHSVGLTTDGRVLGWGYGGTGIIGNGTSTIVNPLPTFVTPAPGTTFTDVDAGMYANLTVADLNTGPAVAITTPADGAVLEAGSHVEADYACSDAEGLASCEGDVPDGAAIDTSQLGSFTFSATATDTQGLTATATHDYTVVDTTDPAVTITTPAEGATYRRGQTVLADYACTDLLLDSCTGTVPDGAAIDTATVGVKSFTVTGEDTSGNETTKTVSYRVVDATVLLPEPSILRLGPGLDVTLTFRARLVDSAGSPLAGRRVRFAVGTLTGCSATTDSQGFATCGTTLKAVASVLLLGYTASYSGEPDYLGATERGPIVQVGNLKVL